MCSEIIHPICKLYAAHKFNKDLPILFVNRWEDITKDFLEQAYKYVDGSLFDSDGVAKNVLLEQKDQQ